MDDINEKIDRLLHDAEHAASGAIFASRIGHVAPAKELQDKYRRLYEEAVTMFLAHPNAVWPDCEIKAPKRA